MSRQLCEHFGCTNNALVYSEGGSFLCEMHAPVDETRRY